VIWNYCVASARRSISNTVGSGSAKRSVGKTLHTAKLLLLVFTRGIRVQWLWVRIREKATVVRYGEPLKLKTRIARWNDGSLYRLRRRTFFSTISVRRFLILLARPDYVPSKNLVLLILLNRAFSHSQDP
jgi:hypothetical protein